MTIINPAELGKPRGWSNGLLGSAGQQVLFVAGQTAADSDGRIPDPAFTAQFARALGKVIVVVRAAGGTPQHIGRMTIYVTDLDGYLAARSTLRDVWKQHMGDHYPAMTLVEVSRLVDAGATVEIEATALLQ
jgi:enamine deaminase RidA (YjgF/YER057c/UK114 family)